jgi:hypothetical protein
LVGNFKVALPKPVIVDIFFSKSVQDKKKRGQCFSFQASSVFFVCKEALVECI